MMDFKEIFFVQFCLVTKVLPTLAFQFCFQVAVAYSSRTVALSQALGTLKTTTVTFLALGSLDQGLAKRFH